ncbi:response regulator [Neorhizobium sp. IRS_2294]|uniref:response regulator n=1 Tax=unclassified Neorhizobium TaxID=2629175 RepID=UPI003D29708C
MSTVAAEANEGRAAPIKVLFVEDEALIRISTADFLQDAGMGVVEAGTAGEALGLASEQPVDILVTDVHLPDMTGLQLTIKLRDQFPDLPVIFATGDRNVEGAEGLSRSGLVTKPYDYDSLVSLIRSMVSAG